ncbi:formylglycine-generating enzyme family protein [Vibrio navarrensis]|uniref:SUMF1/EgtB/PvdO family nonheme iron enzyme n=1 Tax=Vibrio navarrensis TaxID=29495 RepID=A0AAJ4IFN2_9VIBR|nr:SUMF1/EgtB/PvdO family nonheme iron enzyme [Vibrio navarrensis]
MRLVLSALTLAIMPMVSGTPAMAQEETVSVIAVEDALFSQNTLLNEAEKKIFSKQNELNNQQEQTSRLEAQGKELSSRLQNAKAQLAKDYARISDEPDFDLAPSQNAYQAAWAKVKQNQQQRLESQQQEETFTAELQALKAEKLAIEQKIANLKEDRQRARVATIRSEISQKGEQTVAYVNSCKTDMTLEQCAKQTNTLALQKAVRQYQSALLEGTTESKLAKQNQAQATLNIHVLQQQVSKAEFLGENQYSSVLKVTLNARPAENAPCKLLDIDSKYCFAPSQASEPEKIKETAWHSVVIRSNQYDDRLIIDGVRYGSTPAEVMLPVGQHHIQIEKEGYVAFEQLVVINGDQTLRAELVAKQNVAKPGETFADNIGKHSAAPEMVVVTQGTYMIGERAGKQVKLSRGFSISTTPVTVAQFRAFVDQTNYQTDAELQKVCTRIEQAAITPVANKYWRDPGFSQQDNSPVVCVSQNDAQAYVNWLSDKTGYFYRLPSEDEWEIAARGGSEKAYWWGEAFGVGQANTGWGGTPWSNNSSSPVKSFAPNAFGLYDVIGNVWEWTSDTKGLLKGGAWSFSPEKAKAESQLFIAPSSAANFSGFRVVRQL